MENRFEHSPPEQAGWGAYVPPPSRPESVQADQAAAQSLCQRVRELLPSLLENEDDLRPETVAAIQGHLNICYACAREFDSMQRVVLMLETLPEAELPMDYASLIMQRIQQDTGPARSVERPRPTVAASSLDSGEAAIPARIKTEPALLSPRADVPKSGRIQSEREALTLAQETAYRWEKTLVAAILCMLLSFLLSSPWGRQMVGPNVESAGQLLAQAGEALRRVPGLGLLIGFLAAAFQQVASLLGEAYARLGSAAARGLMIDVALCGLFYYFLFARRQRQQGHGIVGG